MYSSCMCLRQARRELPPVPVSAAATEQPRVIRGASLECPDSDSDEEDNLDLGVWYREVHAAAAPVRSADLRRHCGEQSQQTRKMSIYRFKIYPRTRNN